MLEIPFTNHVSVSIYIISDNTFFLLLLLLSLSLTRGTDVIEKGIVVISTNKTARKDDRVEGNVVLGHELIKLDL